MLDSMRSPLIAAAILLTAVAATAAQPDDKNARELTDRMIAAHGGLERWNKAPTVAFRKLSGPAGKEKETIVVVEQGRRRTYLDWPAEKSQLVSDGTRVWSTNWKQPAPPSFMANLDYYFLGLPWFTRDPGVRLAMGGTGKLPGGTTDHAKVRMSFDAGVGDSSDVYTLYIDQKTNLLRGVEYIVTHPGVVGSKSFIGPFFRIYEEYRNIEGLTVATKALSVDAKGEGRGTNEYRDVSFRRPFDETRMKMPAGAIIDTPTREK
ncbi:MAG TPA: hypothetical protein VNM92_03065 [Thermoanaerobaculia bacterium]|nr:hypothetical protein [Thermoanaerobaculia bacterium]